MAGAIFIGALEKRGFLMIAQEKADSRRTVLEREALAKSALLTENRVLDPVDSAMEINLFSVIGRVRGHKTKVAEFLKVF